MEWSTSDVLRFVALALLLLLSTLLLRDRRDRSAQASLAVCLAGICHLLQLLLEAHAPASPWLHPLVLGGLAVPAAFWVLARVHFDDDCCLRARHWAVFAAVEVIGYLAWLAPREPRVAALLGGHGEAWSAACQALSMTIVAHALLNVWLGSRADLVVSRLRRRYWILGLTGSYVLVERTALALAEGTAGEAAVDFAYSASLALLVFAILVLATLIQPGVLKPHESAPAPEPAADPRLVAELRRLVEAEHVYREEGLTITALATRLGAHEYRVRQLVNAQLGFKNFNAFLHHYRLGEAQRLLADPARRHLTVAQVAFEVGYRSLGPFNRAFKEATGVTPTEFRAARVDHSDRPAESGPAPGPAVPHERPVAG
jgi:AraC-like DNA-binding protein